MREKKAKIIKLEKIKFIIFVFFLKRKRTFKKIAMKRKVKKLLKYHEAISIL